MSERNIKLYPKTIHDSINDIEEFIERMDFEGFRGDDKTSSAVIRKFEIIGEATKNIPESIKEKYPHIPWREMAGFRDKLIHFYFGIKYELVWDTVKLRLPELKENIQRVLKDMEGEK